MRLAVSGDRAGPGIVVVYAQRDRLVRTPDAQRHPGEGSASRSSGSSATNKPDRAPLARPQRRAPQPQHPALLGQLAGVRPALPGPDRVHLFGRRPVGHPGSHRDQIFHTGSPVPRLPSSIGAGRGRSRPGLSLAGEAHPWSAGSAYRGST